MTIPISRDLQSITSRARDVARRSGGPLTSGHLLVALFSSDSTAQELLTDASVSENSVLERLPRAGDEAAGTGERLLAKAIELAAGCGSREVAPLHHRELAAESAFLPPASPIRRGTCAWF